MTFALAELANVLDRHALRRSRSLPTASVLSGPIGLGIACYRRWCGERGVACVQIGHHSQLALAAAWAAELARHRDLAADAFAFLAKVTGRTAGDLQAALEAASLYDLDLFWKAHPVIRDAGNVAAACRWMLGHRARGHRIAPDDLAASLMPVLTRKAPAGWEVISTLAALVPSGSLPAVLLLRPPAFAAGGCWLDSAIRLVLGLAEGMPVLPVALAADAAELGAWLAGGPSDRARTLAREGLLSVSPISAAEIHGRLGSAGIKPGLLDGTVRRLASDGTSEELAAAFATAARWAGTPPAEKDADEARSAAERFLFERLESLPATAGRFALNAPLDFQFGRKPAEVDLLAREEGLVVELDGYYHFTGEDAYRRDRRKDWELQRRGLLVLRFLAADVVTRMEEILDTILAAFDFCSRRAADSNGRNA